MRRFFGVVIFLFGVVLALWIGYNLLIERLPMTQNINPLPGIATCAGCLFVGFKWMKGEQAG